MAQEVISPGGTHFKLWIGLLELSAITAGYFFVVWTIGPNLDSNGLALPLTALLAVFLLYFAHVSPHLIHGDSLAERGLGRWRSAFLRVDNLGPAARSYGKLMVGATVVILLATIFFRPTPLTNINPEAIRIKFGFYLLTALAQDLLFLSFFFLRLRRILEPIPWINSTRRIAVCLLCAMLFALFHLPNAPLMIATLLTGFAASWIWYATPNLGAVVCCHAVIGTLMHQVLEMHMRIGPFYWESEKYVFRTLFPVMQKTIGDLY